MNFSPARVKRILLAAAVIGCFAACKSIEAVSVAAEPSKTIYGQGQNLDVSGLVVNAVYSDGKTRSLAVSPSQVTGYDRHRIGEQTVTITVSKSFASFQVTVVPLLSLSLISPPSRSTLREGETFSLDGLVVGARWAEPVGGGHYPVEGLTVSGFNGDLAGKQIVIASAEGKSVSFEVDVKPLTGIAVQTPPTKTHYKFGVDNLDLRGLVVLGTWDTFGNELLAIRPAHITGYNKDLAGVQRLTIRIASKTATFDVRVVQMSAISVTNPPAKTRYIKGENLDVRGLLVSGTWEGIGTEPLSNVTADNVSGYDRTRIGQQTLKVTVDGKTSTFNVSVAGLSAMRITSYPKLDYMMGEDLNLSGLEIMGTYTDTISSNEQRVPVNTVDVSGYSPDRAGRQILTVSLDGVSTTFPVTVSGYTISPKEGIGSAQTALDY
ncbi:MAG: bacterial Ig-like domain-containing protein [Treponema sp.]|jgi:hypothetical protein|nr:bacterial Ig-like domain-containing protein [Treponema sp.]